MGIGWWQRLRGHRIEAAAEATADAADAEHQAADPLDTLLQAAATGPTTPPDPTAGPTADTDSPFGRPGRPLNRAHPFLFGFTGALGVFAAWGLIVALEQLSQVISLLVMSMFLALGLDPVVSWLTRRGLRRPFAVTVVLLVALGIAVAFISAVVPLLVQQGTELAHNAPNYLDHLLKSPTVRRLDHDYGVITKISAELRARAANAQTVSSVFGGVLGAGRAVLSGFFSAITVLVLTLYFLAALPKIKETVYHTVPRSRRERVRLLGEEVVRRIGGYVLGQIGIASLNAVASFIVLSLVGLPYPAVLAVAVGLLGLVPLIGATLGAIVVIIVALFTSWQLAVGLAIYYLVYQQTENYLIAPRIMSRTVSVPGSVALIAALIGATLLGAIGALIAIPLAAGVLLIIEEVVIPRQQRT